MSLDLNVLDFRLQLMISEYLLKKIDDYRFTKRIGSRGEAVRELIEDSLDRWEKSKKEKKPEK